MTSALTDRELQSLRNMGNEAERAADEIERLRGIVPEVLERLNDELCAENERLRASLTLAANRLDRLALDLPHGSSAQHEAGEWAGEARSAA